MTLTLVDIEITAGNVAGLNVFGNILHRSFEESILQREVEIILK